MSPCIMPITCKLNHFTHVEDRSRVCALAALIDDARTRPRRQTAVILVNHCFLIRRNIKIRTRSESVTEIADKTSLTRR